MITSSLQHKVSAFSPYLLRILDLLAVFLSALIAYYFRFDSTKMPDAYQLLIVMACLIVFSITSYKSVYQSVRGQYGFNLLAKLCMSWLLASFVLFSILVFTHQADNFSRIFLGTWWLCLFLFMTVSRILLYGALAFIRTRGSDVKTIHIIGDKSSHALVTNKLASNSWSGFRVGSFFDSGDLDFNRLETEIIEADEDEIWICLPLSQGSVINEIMNNLDQSTRNIRYIPNIEDLRLLNNDVHQVAGLNVLTLSADSLDGLNSTIKHLEDLILGVIFTVLTAPVMLIIAIVIKSTSKGPVLFKQKRHGLGGEEISVYKFRSMRVHEEEVGKITQAVKGDSRVTRVGEFIRKTSLDELPQFWNVVQGKMSIVGPRPHALAHNDDYRERVESYMTRHKVKPGITGWAQVNGLRGETDTLEKMQKRVEFDLYYIDNWSFWFDIKIIIMTVFTGFFGKNTY
jgi:putative colanic acid biosynthesis UDP-glucose lipid carrier transferase